MGRNYKEHDVISIRFEANLHERLKEYLEKINKGKNKKITKTAFIEKAVEIYLNHLEDDLDIDRM